MEQKIDEYTGRLRFIETETKNMMIQLEEVR
jgi:hypothetical protein